MTFPDNPPPMSGGQPPVVASDASNMPLDENENKLLTVGIDFGTAFTKVAIRAYYEREGEDKAYAVDFGGRVDPCLLPTALWGVKNNRKGDEVYSIHKLAGGERYTKIKSDIINSSQNSDLAFARAAAYLGLVIQKSRGFAEARKSRWFGRSTAGIDMNGFNVGIPAEIARGELADKYARIVNAAVELSKCRKITLQKAKQAIDSVRDETSINLVPEVIAQAYGYTRDPAAAEGIHIMVDIGAWTLDVCSFINQTRDDQLDLQVACVRPMGCLHLHRARLDFIRRDIFMSAELSILPDQFLALPQMEEYCRLIERKMAGIAGVMRHADDAFRNGCTEIIKGTISTVGTATGKILERQGGLPVIICGGGSEIPLFPKSAREGWEKARKERWPEGYKVPKGRFIQLPLPRKPGLIGRGINDGNYHRFSVAWGLSYPEIFYKLRGGNVEPLNPPRPVRDPRDNYFGKEQM